MSANIDTWTIEDWRDLFETIEAFKIRVFTRKKHHVNVNIQDTIDNENIHADIKERPISDLKLSTRASGCVRRLDPDYKRYGPNAKPSKVQKIGDLCQYSRDDLSSVKNCGEFTCREIVKKLQSFGLFLND